MNGPQNKVAFICKLWSNLSKRNIHKKIVSCDRDKSHRRMGATKYPFRRATAKDVVVRMLKDL